MHSGMKMRLAQESFQSCPEIFRDDAVAGDGAYVRIPEQYAQKSAQPYRDVIIPIGVDISDLKFDGYDRIFTGCGVFEVADYTDGICTVSPTRVPNPTHRRLRTDDASSTRRSC